MLKFLSIGLISLVTTLAYPSLTLAETVLERVAKTGVLTVGVRTDIVPYSYVNDQQELTGYSVELVELIRQQLEEDLGKEVQIDYVTSENFSDRIDSVISKEVDLICDTIFTWERDKFVDFSLGYGVSGIKLLTKKSSNLNTAEALKGKRIGFVENTFQERSINLLNSDVIPVEVASLQEGLEAVESGKIDGLAFDAVILEGMRQTMSQPDDFVVIPENSYYNHGIACMIPQGDSSFLHSVNYAIIKMMDGYLAGDKRYTEMVNRYFGEEGIVSFDPEIIRNFFEMVIITREQIPPSPQ
jgi:polar amino acid transport system substrate-binding protein